VVDEVPAEKHGAKAGHMEGQQVQVGKVRFRFLTGGLADGRSIDAGRAHYCRQRSHVVVAAHQGGFGSRLVAGEVGDGHGIQVPRLQHNGVVCMATASGSQWEAVRFTGGKQRNELG
jgi:hypothetical protein